MNLRTNIFVAALVLAGAMLPTAPLQGQQTNPEKEEDPRLDPPRIKLEGQPVEMSLSDVVMETFRNNLDLDIRQSEVVESDAAIMTQRGIYDPELVGSVTQTRTESESYSTDGTFTGQTSASSSSSVLDPGEDDNEVDQYSIAINQLLPTGGSFTLGLDRDVYEDNNAPNSRRNPSDEPRVFARLTHPLLKNFGPKVTNYGINVAKLQEKLSRALYHQEVEMRLAEVMDAYWDLVFAIRNLEVQKASLESALELERVNDLRVETGTAPRSDLFQAQATVAERRNNVIRAKSQILAAQDLLLSVMNWNKPANEWNRPVIPLDRPTSYSLELELDESALVDEAFEYRNDLDALRFAYEVAELTKDVQAWQRLPELNLILEYGLSGYDNSFGDAFDEIESSDYSDYTYGVEFRYPLLNRRQRGLYAQSKANLEQSGLDIDRLELGIVTQVRAATRLVRAAQESILASQAQVKAAEETLFAEQKRLEVGSSTTFNVLEFQEDLALAQVNEVQALVYYQQGLIELARSRGRLLEFIGNDVDVVFIFDSIVEEDDKSVR